MGTFCNTPNPMPWCILNHNIYFRHLKFIPDICHGVNFYKFNAKNWQFTVYIGNLLCKLAIYCVNFGVNFTLQKFCLCKKNDKYEVCAPLTHYLP